MGDFNETGQVEFTITAEHAEAQTFADHEAINFTITVNDVEDFQLEDHEAIHFTITTPDTGIEVFNIGVPGYVGVNVTIDSENVSNYIQGAISITREDNTAARFKLSLDQDPDLLLRKKPVEFINKIISIGFSVADMDGLVADYIPIFTGICKKVSFNEDVQTYIINGYDYGGVHQTKGELISENITQVHTGAVSADSAETIVIGQSPIWGVVWNGNSSVVDGEDYFVDTQNGKIIIPISSRILQFPSSFNYNYADPFNTMKDIISAIVSIKGWVIDEDGVTIVDYTGASAHPVLSISNESVIDMGRKFLELSGAKVESNLFPDLRVYSEVENWVNEVGTVTVDESKIFENTLVFNIDFDNLLNEQTVRSVQKVNANIAISGSTLIATYEGSQGSLNPFTFNSGSSVNDVDWNTPQVLVSQRISKKGIASISFVATGTFYLNGGLSRFEASVLASDWSYRTDGDDFVFELKHVPVTAHSTGSGVYAGSGTFVIAYPAIEDWTLEVYGTKIEYGGGTTEDIKVVTAQRPITGITDTLAGDVYENAYIETAAHCVNIANAILLEHGNPYTASFEMPLFEGKDAQIGDRMDIERGGDVIFSGIIKTLTYNVDTNSGINSLLVGAKGVGRGI